MCIGIDRKKRQLNPTWGVDRRHLLHMNVYKYIEGAVCVCVCVYSIYNVEISSSLIRQHALSNICDDYTYSRYTYVVPLSIRH
jgi:hypothetical protein